MPSVWVSMELVASSRIITGGSATAARAMARSCLCPWLKLAPLPMSILEKTGEAQGSKAAKEAYEVGKSI